ncbi:glycosyltransferase family 2 protein [Phycicoccus avicenniae]|uniref:glycosyltransferase family 2 protein n=1 Tax=Phycicoccus avicenniae TaxID=2828860 RepID=UPI003D2E1874
MPQPQPKVSVVVPVYNPGPNIRFLLESLEAQSLPAGEFEVVFVDDGSTDGTGESLRAECERAPHLTYTRIENSGWPGRPRNVGTDLARGEYVFYADNDDVIPERGLELMHAFASEHRADVLVAREVGRGRIVSKEVFRRDVPDARLGRDPILGILTPHKLYRRQFLADHGIRFREGRFRLEDHLFNIQSFVAAERIAVYAGFPCYVWTKRKDPDGSTNASYDEWSGADYYLSSLHATLRVVHDAVPDAELRDRLLAHWYDTKMLMRLTDKRFLKYTPERRRELFDAIGELTASTVPPSVDQHLPVRVRMRSALLRAGDLDALEPLAESDVDVVGRLVTTGVGTSQDAVTFSVTMTMEHRDGRPLAFEADDDRLLLCVPAGTPDVVRRPEVRDATRDVAAARFDGLVVERGSLDERFVDTTGEVRAEPLAGDPGSLVVRGTGTATLTGALLRELAPTEPLDLKVRLWVGGWSMIRRLAAPEGAEPGAVLASTGEGERRIELYVTEHGNLSVRHGVHRPKAPRPPQQPTGVRAVLARHPRVRRVVRALLGRG